MTGKRHPGYIVGNHWLETAYDRICAGEPEDKVLADYDVHRVQKCTCTLMARANCGLAAEAVKAEREACLSILRDMEGKKWHIAMHGGEMKGVSLHDAYTAIRARGNSENL